MGFNILKKKPRKEVVRNHIHSIVIGIIHDLDGYSEQEQSKIIKGVFDKFIQLKEEKINDAYSEINEVKDALKSLKNQ